MLTRTIKDSKTGISYAIISINAPGNKYFIQVFMQRPGDVPTEVLPMEYEDKESRDRQFTILENSHNARKFCDGIKKTLDTYKEKRIQEQQQNNLDENE